MTVSEAIAFIEIHGIVLASAKGPVANLADVIAGEPIKGSWWAHAEGKQIFAVLQAVADSDQVLVCRLLNGKITFIHRRLWPALVRVADRFPVQHLAQVKEQHTASGRHLTQEKPFPEWVPAAIAKQATKLTEADALATLGISGLKP